MAANIKYTRPFYDGLGNPLIGATITLRNESGTVIFYTLTEQTADGMSGVYSCNIIVSRQYFIWAKPNALSNAECIGDFSPSFIPSIDI